MTALVDLSELHEAWPVLAPMLARVVKRSPDPDAGRLLHVLKEGSAQLWAIVEGGQPVAVIVTRVSRETPARCLVWLIAGSRVREWGQDFMATLVPWARERGCAALYGIGRRGWDRVVPALGFERVGVEGDRLIWERRL